MTESILRIATRSSALALWQAEHIKSLIETKHADVSVEIVHVKTVGDRNQTDALRQFGGTGVFTREVQLSVLDGDTDLAVHSLKDLPTESAPGLQLAGIPDRAPTADVLLLPGGEQLQRLESLPADARIGTGSPRRQAQLLHYRDDLQMLEIRGNVDTRIRKLDEGEYDAIILAEAGLRRLGLADRISHYLSPPVMFCAVGQGAIGVECRDDDEFTAKILRSITNADVSVCTRAERSLLKELRAGCHAPLGVQSSIEEDDLTLTGVLLSLDGQNRLEVKVIGSVTEPEVVGAEVAELLLAEGGAEFISQADPD